MLATTSKASDEARTIRFPYTPDPDPVRTEWTVDSDDTVHINRVQDCEPARERCREIKRDNTGGWNKGRDMRLAYSIPSVFFERWASEDGSPGRPFNPFKLRKEAFSAWVERHIQKDDCSDFRIDGNRPFHLYMGLPAKPAQKLILPE